MNFSKATITARSNACQQCTQASSCLLARTPNNKLALRDFQFPARLLMRGEHLCHQGQSTNHLYIVRTGILKSYVTKPNGDEYVMGFYFPADLFGFEGIDETHKSIAIIALDQSNICVISTEKMFELTQHIPSIGTQLMRMVSKRIHQDNIALLRTTAAQRVATFLLQLASRYEQMRFPTHTFPLLMTHQDIANYLRITPSTISRIFHEWQTKKIIDIKKHMIYLRDLSHVKLLAEVDSNSI